MNIDAFNNINEISSIITAKATVVSIVTSVITTIATVFMAIAAWQAKNSYKKKLEYDNYLEITELLECCRDELSNLSIDSFEDLKRKQLTEKLNRQIDKLKKLFNRAKKFNNVKNLKIEKETLVAIIKFYINLVQEACPYEGVQRAYVEYLEKIIELKKIQNEYPLSEEIALNIHKSHL